MTDETTSLTQMIKENILAKGYNVGWIGKSINQDRTVIPFFSYNPEKPKEGNYSGIVTSGLDDIQFQALSKHEQTAFVDDKVAVAIANMKTLVISEDAK